MKPLCLEAVSVGLLDHGDKQRTEAQFVSGHLGDLCCLSLALNRRVKGRKGHTRLILAIDGTERGTEKKVDKGLHEGSIVVYLSSAAKR